MAEIAKNVELNFQVTLKLTETEALALDALVGYGLRQFLDVFYKHMGRAYLGNSWLSATWKRRSGSEGRSDAKLGQGRAVLQLRRLPGLRREALRTDRI